MRKNNLYGRHENNCVEDDASTHITEQIGGAQVITTYRIAVRSFLTANGTVQEIMIWFHHFLTPADANSEVQKWNKLI